MRLAIASGKGGTGKTTVATNLAVVAAAEGDSVHLLDCDVEEPNCHLFLPPEIASRRDVTAVVPAVDSRRCTGCGDCAAICEFNALACLPDDVLVFPELCHGCAGCWLVCPEKAITPGERVIGELIQGRTRGVRLTQGSLRVGEALAVPLIRRVIAATQAGEISILDAPPGTACPVVQTVLDSDYVLLVTEPTPFGLHDLTLAVQLMRELQLRYGVILNRADGTDFSVHEYCEREGIRMWLEIPEDRLLAEAYCRGRLAVDALPAVRASFQGLWRRLKGAIAEVCA